MEMRCLALGVTIGIAFSMSVALVAFWCNDYRKWKQAQEQAREERIRKNLAEHELKLKMLADRVRGVEDELDAREGE